MPNEQFPFVYVHRTMGLHIGCGENAFYLMVKPEAGALLQSSQSRHLDGTTVAQGELIRCGSCKQLVPYVFASCVVET